MLTSETKRRIDAARDVLVGKLCRQHPQEQNRIMAVLGAEAARLERVRGLIPSFEAKIARTLARLRGTC